MTFDQTGARISSKVAINNRAEAIFNYVGLVAHIFE